MRVPGESNELRRRLLGEISSSVSAPRSAPLEADGDDDDSSMLDVDQRFCRGGVAGSEASMSATAGGIGVDTRRTGTSDPCPCTEVGTEYIDKTSYMLARPSSLSRSTMSDRTENGRTPPVLLRGAAAAALDDDDDDSLAARREFRSLIKLSLLNPPTPISGDELSETEVASECQPASSVAVEDENEVNMDVEANEVPVEMDADDEVEGGGAGKPIGKEGEPPGPFFVGSDDDEDVFRIEGPGRGASGPALETILSRAEIVARFCCCFLSADERDQGNERNLRPMLVPVALLVVSTTLVPAGETRS